MNTQVYHLDDEGEACADPASHQRHDMLVEIDFKWLMAGLGHHVDPARLKNDATYAHACLDFALHSNCDPLRTCAACLSAELAQSRQAQNGP